MLLLKRWLVGAVQVDGVHRRSLHGGQAHLVGQVRHPLLRGQDVKWLAPHKEPEVAIDREVLLAGGGNSRFPATSRGAPPTPGFPSKLVGGNSKLPTSPFPFDCSGLLGSGKCCSVIISCGCGPRPGHRARIGAKLFPGEGKRRRPKRRSPRHGLRCGGEGGQGGGWVA